MIKKITLVTVTQYKRMKYLELLFESVTEAMWYESVNNKPITYEVIEWVIVDGSETRSQTKALRNKINKITKQMGQGQVLKPPKIRFVSEPEGPKAIGYLRELSNRILSPDTDIVVVQDDDDFMCKTRLEATTAMFNQHDDCNLVGCGNHLMYDYDTNIVFTFDKEIHPEHHSVNCVYAYSYQFAQDNHYDETKTFSEEVSFTETFTKKMYHISPLDCILQMSFANNTYNKYMVKAQALSFEQYYQKPLCVVTRPVLSLEFIVGHDKAERYRKLFKEEYDLIRDKRSFDVTYYAGFNSISWNPKDLKSLGGSESAIIHLARQWAKAGLSVQVFGRFDDLEFKDYLEYQGVTWKHANKFSFQETYKNLILWRVSGLLLLNDYVKVKANKVMVDLHDHNEDQYRMAYFKHRSKIDLVFYKTQFHKAIADHQFNLSEFSDQKAVIVPNGVEVHLFSLDKEKKSAPVIIKDPYRFQYSSSYFRGLKEILKFMWPKIIEKIPEATLFCYYGFNKADPEDERKEIEMLLMSSKNVYDMGRVSREVLADEKKKASYHLYPSLTTSEIDCISLKESLLAENVLILSDKNIFQTFPGIKIMYENGMSIEDYYTSAGVKLADDLTNPENKDKIENLREIGKSFDQICQWSQSAAKWLPYFSK